MSVSMQLGKGTYDWGSGAIRLNSGIDYTPGIYRRNIEDDGGEPFFILVANTVTNGTPIAGQCKIKMQFQRLNKTFWVNAWTQSNGWYTHPTNDYGEILNGVNLGGGSLATSETTNYIPSGYRSNGSAYSDRFWIAIKMSDFLSATGINPETAQPEKITLTYYTRTSSSEQWSTSSETVYLYRSSDTYPKVTATYTGRDLKNNKYYDNLSTLILTVTVTDSAINGNTNTNVVEINAGNTIKRNVTFDYSSLPTNSQTFTVELNTFNEYISITAKNKYSTNGGWYSFEIPYFPYIPPKVYQSTAYRIGDEYETIKLDAVGEFVDKTEFPVTFKYRWRLQGGTWSNWVNIQTVPIGSIGPIEKSVEFDSVVTGGNVQIQLSLSDTLVENTYTIYVGGPVLFSWSGNDFKFTVPVYINTNETPITINGVTLDDYIRGIV